MAYNVSALTDYVREFEHDLVTRTLFTGRTAELIYSEGNVWTGIKSSEDIDSIDTDATFQAGGTCGFNASGATTFGKRNLAVGKIKIHEALCPKDLERKATQKKLKAGSNPTEIPFEQEYAELKAGIVAEQLETAIWQGDTNSANANLNKFDGLIKIIDTAALAANGNPTGITVVTGITTSDVVGIVQGMWGALPARLMGKSDVRIFCGWDTFNKFITAYTSLNLFAFAPNGNEVSQENGEVIIPGTNYKLTAVHGLDGTNRLFAIRMSNLYIGTDLENEEESYEIFYAKEAMEVRFVSEFKFGVQVAYPNEVVSFKLV